MRSLKPTSTDLTLITSGFELALAGHDPSARLAVLERLLARGDHRPPAPLPDDACVARWQAMLLEILDPPLEWRGHASAPVSWLGSGGDPFDGYCQQVSPVHIATLTDRLQLLPPGPVTDHEMAQLAGHLATALDTDGQEFVWLAPGRWYLRGGGVLDARTVPLDRALGADMRETLPTGSGAAALRRLMTEAQMLLHEHPVNERRAAMGQRTINGVWVWGGGTCPESRTRCVPQLAGDDPYVRGLARLANEDVLPVDPAILESPATRGRPVALVVDIDTLDDFERNWLAPIVAALRRHRFPRIRIGLGARWVTVSARHLHRFWRRNRALEDALQ